nr:(+)-limonene 3-hydroxylase [Schizonepeta tenuifolia]WBW02124.1 limonene 3-hydroxylase [Schizonepeta tenuifolia]
MEAMDFLWALILVVASYIIMKQRQQLRAQAKYSRLPPSPPKLPVIGHLHLFGRELPQHVLGRVAEEHGAVAHVQLGEVFTVVLSSAEAAKEALQTLDPACADRFDSISSKIMWYDNKDIIFSPFNEHWRHMRKICVMELLSARNVRSFGCIRQDEMSRLIDSLRSSAGSGVDMTEKICTMTCSIICRAAFGSVIKDYVVLVDLVKQALGMASGFELPDLFPSSTLLNLLSWNKSRLWKMRRRVDSIVEAIVDEHRLKQSTGEFGGEDIIDVLLRMEKDTTLRIPITLSTIKAFIFDTFSAGTETSSTTTLWVMAELMKNPAVMAKAQAEVRAALKGKSSVDMEDVQDLKYLKAVVKETMRMHPPIPLLPRQCRDECEVLGYTIPKKARVVVNMWYMGRDPRYWDEPLTFRPERFERDPKDFTGNDFELIPFGAGRRICPGLNFGLANVEVPLAQLLYHFDWKLPSGVNPADMDMDETPGLTGIRRDNLVLIPTPYYPN